MTEAPPPTIDELHRHWPRGATCSPAEEVLLVRLLEVLSELEAWKGPARRLDLDRLSPCSRCGAQTGQPCTRPDGRDYVDETRGIHRGEALHHAPRLDVSCQRFNGACVDGWHGDLRHSPACIRSVKREIKASHMYRALVRAGLLEPLEGK